MNIECLKYGDTIYYVENFEIKEDVIVKFECTETTVRLVTKDGFNGKERYDKGFLSSIWLRLQNDYRKYLSTIDCAIAQRSLDRAEYMGELLKTHTEALNKYNWCVENWTKDDTSYSKQNKQK